MSGIEYEVRDGIAVLRVNNPPVNAMSPGVPRGICEGVAKANDDPLIKAIVLAGAGRSFVAGADIRYFSRPWPEGEQRIGDVIAAFEGSRKPVIAAIHGHALGGGLELAMACHYRVAAPSAQLGQPEVKLGFPPGAGGTQRLPRLAGVVAALDMIVSGNPVRAGKAKDIGIVDQIIAGDLLEGAIRFAAEVGARPVSHPRARDLEIRLDDPGIFDAKRGEIARSARGLRAPYACIECVEAAVSLPFDAGVKREREIFERCMRSDESKALRNVFFAERAAAKVPGAGASVALKSIRKIGVLGAGTMGSGIAMSFANAGIPVTMVEQTKEALDRGMGAIRRTYTTAVEKGRSSREAADKCVAFITPSLAYEDLADTDLVIEAVFEEMAIKKQVFARLDQIAREDAILASNTSYLNIDEIAATVPRRHGFVLGTHFFSPAHVMRLLEVVRTKTVSDQVLLTVLDLGKRLGKLPIVAGVGHGFIGNRMFEAYIGEASMMVEEGAEPRRIDAVLQEYGMAMGPLSVIDLAGNDISWRKRKDAGGGVAADSRGAYIANRLCEMGHFGQKAGRGYYLYEAGNRAPIHDPNVLELAAKARAHFGLQRRELSDQEILGRCLYALVNIGAKILEEGIALRASDIDLVYVNGYGFAVWRGGPMYWGGTVGLAKVYDAVRHYHDTLGSKHWVPSPLLARLAKDGTSFVEFDNERAV